MHEIHNSVNEVHAILYNVHAICTFYATKYQVFMMPTVHYLYVCAELYTPCSYSCMYNVFMYVLLGCIESNIIKEAHEKS